MILVCCYCGRDVPAGVESALFACCGEVGHTCTLAEWEKEEQEAAEWVANVRSLDAQPR